MSNLEQGMRWINQAKRDLKTARILEKNDVYELACFHCQQAGEKALKGYLYSRGIRSIVTHSIRELIREAAKKNKEFNKLERAASELDREYIPSRYPDSFPSGIPAEYYSKEDVEKCIRYAESILKTAQKHASD